MNFIVESIIDAVVRSITYAIVYSVSQTIHTSIKKSVNNQIMNNLSKLVGADGEIDEEKINSLIQVEVFPLELGQYQVHIQEEVFGILDYSGTTTRDTENLISNIKKSLVSKKLRFKILKDTENYEATSMLLEGFK